MKDFNATALIENGKFYLCNEFGSKNFNPSIIQENTKIYLCDEYGNKGFYPSYFAEGGLSQIELILLAERLGLL
jgi:hypothetical protein